MVEDKDFCFREENSLLTTQAVNRGSAFVTVTRVPVPTGQYEEDEELLGNTAGGIAEDES